MALNRSATESVDELQLKHLNQSQTELIASSTIEQLSASLQQLNNSPVANLLLSSSASNLFTLNNNGHVLNKWPPFDSSQTDDEFKCPKCKEVMFNVHQADECGCRFCFECLNRMLVIFFCFFELPILVNIMFVVLIKYCSRETYRMYQVWHSIRFAISHTGQVFSEENQQTVGHMFLVHLVR